MLSQEFINKLKLSVLVEHYSQKTYSWFENVYYTCEYMWVHSWHKYWETEKYKLWTEVSEYVDRINKLKSE